MIHYLKSIEYMRIIKTMKSAFKVYCMDEERVAISFPASNSKYMHREKQSPERLLLQGSSDTWSDGHHLQSNRLCLNRFLHIRDKLYQHSY